MKNQEIINAHIEAVIDAFNHENAHTEPLKWKRLRTCTAEYAELENYVVLRSYNTIVALYDKNTYTCYDFLRLVYGYTATSAQHISKFWHDCGAAKVLTWRKV